MTWQAPYYTTASLSCDTKYKQVIYCKFLDSFLKRVGIM